MKSIELLLKPLTDPLSQSKIKWFILYWIVFCVSVSDSSRNASFIAKKGVLRD